MLAGGVAGGWARGWVVVSGCPSRLVLLLEALVFLLQSLEGGSSLRLLAERLVQVPAQRGLEVAKLALGAGLAAPRLVHRPAHADAGLGGRLQQGLQAVGELLEAVRPLLVQLELRRELRQKLLAVAGAG